MSSKKLKELIHPKNYQLVKLPYSQFGHVIAREILFVVAAQGLSELAKAPQKSRPTQHSYMTLLYEWLYPPESRIKRSKVARMLRDLDERERKGIHVGLERDRILWFSGKAGPPFTKRLAAVHALLYREYFTRDWDEITKAVCPCGKDHDRRTVWNNRIFDSHRETLQTQVRLLGRVLRDCQIELPKVCFTPTPHYL